MADKEEVVKEYLKRSIFDIVEFLTNCELSNSGKKLILNYFNNSKEVTSEERALAAVERYFPESLPSIEDTPKKLRQLLDRMANIARKWDSMD